MPSFLLVILCLPNILCNLYHKDCPMQHLPQFLWLYIRLFSVKHLASGVLSGYNMYPDLVFCFSNSWWKSNKLSDFSVWVPLIQNFLHALTILLFCMLDFFSSIQLDHFLPILIKKILKYVFHQNLYVSRDSTLSTATRHMLDSPGIKSRWRVKFSTSTQTNPTTHPASCTMVIGSLSWG
jgi:hypothetical protein